jgi:membrane AbrB-like protein
MVALKWLALTAASLLCGALAVRASIPAAWLIAPMLVAILLSVNGIGLKVPRPVLAVPQGIIGLTIAQVFTLPILGEVARSWLPILVVVGATVAAAGVAGWILAKYSPLSPETAAWGSSPGAAVTMIALSGDYGADPRVVAFMQYLRVTFVVLTASFVSRVLFFNHTETHAAASAPGTTAFALGPFLLTLAVAIATGFAGRYSRIPGGQFIVPLLAGSTIHVTGLFPIDIPWWLLAAAYITVGWTIGLLYTRETLRFVWRILPTLVLSTTVLLTLCAVSGLLLVVLMHADPLTAYLATTPGGLDSVSIIALGSGSNVALVLAIQMLRLFAVVASGPPLPRAIARFA